MRFNDFFRFEGLFEGFFQDVNAIDFSNLQPEWGPSPDIIINTSCEHFEDSRWWQQIPSFQFVVLQSNNYFSHRQHVASVENIEEMLQKYPTRKILFSGQRNYNYGELNFSRFMIIGL